MAKNLNQDLTNLPRAQNSEQNVHTQLERTIFVARVVDAYPYLHEYEIQRDTSGGNIKARTLISGAADMFAPRFYATYPVGTKVLCYKQQDDPAAVILGSVVDPVGNRKFNTSDWMLQQSRCTFFDDKVHFNALNIPAAPQDYASHRPYDIYPGEQGLAGPLGNLLHLGLLTNVFRMSDLNGIWMFKQNQMMRLVAQHLQQWIAGRETDEYVDGLENNYVETYTPYFWEGLGVLNYQQSPFYSPHTENYGAEGPDPLFKPGLEDARYEPQYSQQKMFARSTRLKGYLGDLDREIISCPNYNSSFNIETYNSSMNPIGLAELTKHINGQLVVRSLKGIRFQKDVFIPVPQQVRPHDDPNGDDLGVEDGGSNYNFAGQVLGEDAETHRKPEFKSESPSTRIAELYDEMAWLHNYSGTQALQRHRKDWKLTQFKYSEQFNQTSTYIDLDVLETGATRFKAEFPKYAEIQVDHREEHTHKFYAGRSVFDLRDDGSVVIGDAWGSQIVMSQGNIFISPAYDILFQPGRNMHALVPNDINLRAGHAMDLTAGRSDVRVKAEKNLHMLAGNSGRGGLLLETRGQGFTEDYQGKFGTEIESTGIVLLARDSHILQYGKAVYLRSLDNGTITLDADSGRGKLNFYGYSLTRLLGGYEASLYGTTPENGEDPEGYIYTNSNLQLITLSSGIIANVDNFVQPKTGSDMLVNGSIQAIEMADEDAELAKTAGLAGNVTRQTQNINAIKNSSIKQATSEANSGGNTPYADSGVGTEDFLEQIGFTLRTDEQYAIEDFELLETQWQQFYTAKNSSLLWEENPVTKPNGEGLATMPFPGFKNWQEETRMRLIAPRLWNYQDGEVEDLGVYDDYEAKETTPTKLSEGYRITYQGAD